MVGQMHGATLERDASAAHTRVASMYGAPCAGRAPVSESAMRWCGVRS